MTKRNNVVAVFVRKPELGKVKTRISAEVGDDKALEIYNTLLDLTFSTLNTSNEKVVLYVTHHFQDLNNHVFEQRLQADGDLGIKMFNTFTDLLISYDHVVLMGSDCPYISPKIIQEAFQLLLMHDIVIGPSTDGGYYLIGMKKPNPSLFENISWSTDAVLSQTINAAKKSNLSYALLEPLTDIDHYSDWQEYLNVSNL